MAGNEGTCEASLRQLILAACDFLAEVASGCQKNQRQFEPFVESQVKAIHPRIFAGRTEKPLEPKIPELKATMVSWAITGAALQWSRKREDLGGRIGGCRSSDHPYRIAGRGMRMRPRKDQE